jgi:hypothetical protein
MKTFKRLKEAWPCHLYQVTNVKTKVTSALKKPLQFHIARAFVLKAADLFEAII